VVVVIVEEDLAAAAEGARASLKSSVVAAGFGRALEEEKHWSPWALTQSSVTRL